MIATDLTAFIVGIAFLIGLSLIDFMTFNKKNGAIPSAFTTLFLIIAFVFSVETSPYTIPITLGVLGALIGLLFTDLDLWGGIADYKIFIACTMLMSSIEHVLIFSLVLTILAVLIKGYVKLFVTKGKDWEIPFIPVILIAYVVSGALRTI